MSVKRIAEFELPDGNYSTQQIIEEQVESLRWLGSRSSAVAHSTRVLAEIPIIGIILAEQLPLLITPEKWWEVDGLALKVFAGKLPLQKAVQSLKKGTN